MGNLVCPAPDERDEVAEAQKMLVAHACMLFLCVPFNSSPFTRFRLCELRERFLTTKRDEKIIAARTDRNALRRELPVIKQMQFQINKLGLLKIHFEQVLTIKETSNVLTTVRDHLNRSEGDALPSLDGVEDLQDALEQSHSIFEDIDQVLKASWAGEKSSNLPDDQLEAELNSILGLGLHEPPSERPPPSQPLQEQPKKMAAQPPSSQASDSLKSFPRVPASTASSPSSASSVRASEPCKAVAV